ncbi:SDR family NAD(P)-dependent oxidoreductase [Limnobacter litoralis]|uniref:Short-chain dehydrogenase n=1 Tax=Limnobacter litoralis TaxID=481366 RepID=A0ABQ5YM75_9BURK|nr:SDR family NAD(P)-dependent oxidoreductase [Limnobacter litoralis]GLR25066.1 short-chain dehydrogenase [Limnobacter litoralis]
MSKTIVITGASSGIGAALAHYYASQGCALGLTARRIERLEALKTELTAQHGVQIEVMSLDVNRVDQIDGAMTTLIEKLGGDVDILIVNAGANQLTKVGNNQLSEELGLLQTNLLGAVATIHFAARYFKTRGKGHIVGISSLASLMPIPRQAAYCATKAGLSMYLDTAAIELKRHNVAVTKILPGFVKTEIVDDMDKYPFVVSANEAARQIAGHIERGSGTGVVPAYPWRFFKPVMGKMPTSLWRFFK